MGYTELAMVKTFLSMLTLPLVVIGLLSNAAFLGIWAAYGIEYALAYWIVYCAIGFAVPKSWVKCIGDYHTNRMFAILAKAEKGAF